MNIQALSALLAALVTLALGASVLLKDRRRPGYTAFAAMTLALGLYYALTFVAAATDNAWFTWLSYWPAAFIPTTALRFFRGFLAEPAARGRTRSPRGTYAWTVLLLLALLYGAIFEPVHRTLWFQVPFVVYVFTGLYRCVLNLWVQYRATALRVERARLRYLMIGGFVATTLALTDLLPRLGVAFPTLGNVFTILYLYFLSQTLFRYRLLDLNELVGKMVVLGTLVGILTVVYGLLLVWVGGGKQQGVFILNTVVASFVILILFEPVRTILENTINRWLVRERYELRGRMDGLRRELMNVLDIREAVRRILGSLEESRRITHASIYLPGYGKDDAGFDLVGHVGERPVERLDLAARRPLFDRLRGGPVIFEALDRERLRAETTGGDAGRKDAETLDAIGRALDELKASLVVPIVGGDDDTILGIICLRDERLQNAFGLDDLDLFRALAAQAAITIENSRVYERMKERDRLAALGEMAAGLAHEIRNPLGAIKGAAQLLTAADGRPVPDKDVPEFLRIIVEETNRLNRVVSQFLDYARPYKGEAAEVDVNDVVKRTVQLLEPQKTAEGTTIELGLDAALPTVRGDAEQLRQVFLNLGLNALQAMPQGGQLMITTGRRQRRGSGEPLVEIRFADSGVGMSQEQLGNLFIPFYTTKEKGTGLGLPISQRIVTQHGGSIEVRSERGRGTVFTVILPEAGATAITTTGTMQRPRLRAMA